MNSQKPSYNIADFISECASGSPEVTVSYDAGNEAKSKFNLPTDKDIISFIGNGGLNIRTFKNTESLRKDLAGNKGRMVDAYHFRSGRKIGYIAFIYNDEKKQWRIKSFKDDSARSSFNLKKLLGVI